MELTQHPYQTEDDYWRIRAFLRQVFLLNDRRELSWQAYRFDYWRWHGIENIGQGPLEKTVFIWETPDGQVAAVLNPENTGIVFLQVHPALRTPELEEEMMVVAEQNLMRPRPNGERRLWIFAHADDGLRQDILKRRGYIRRDVLEHHHCRMLSAPIPAAPVAAGYTVRALGDVDELPRAVGCRGKPFTRTSQTSATRDGSGIATYNGARCIAATWTWWRLPQTANSPRSARFGSTT